MPFIKTRLFGRSLGKDAVVAEVVLSVFVYTWALLVVGISILLDGL